MTSRIVSLGLLCVIAFGCRRRVETRSPQRTDAPADASVLSEFRDTTGGGVRLGGAPNVPLTSARVRDSLRTVLRRQRDLWQANAPMNYRYLSRTQCFCPGQRGWLLIDVAGGQPQRAWDTKGASVQLTDWNTLTIDQLFDSVDRMVAGHRDIYIAYDDRLHYPALVRGTSQAVVDGWSIIEARALRPR